MGDGKKEGQRSITVELTACAASKTLSAQTPGHTGIGSTGQLVRPTKETAGPMYRALPVSRQLALTGGRGVVRVIRRVSFFQGCRQVG
jgi:hypothetical protein